MPARWNRRHEPFIGGAALFFRVAPARAVLNDWNVDLVNLYTTVTYDVTAVVIKRLEHHRTKYLRGAPTTRHARSGTITTRRSL